MKPSDSMCKQPICGEVKSQYVGEVYKPNDVSIQRKKRSEMKKKAQRCESNGERGRDEEEGRSVEEGILGYGVKNERPSRRIQELGNDDQVRAGHATEGAEPQRQH